MQRRLVLLTLSFVLVLVARPAEAHFPWITINDEGEAIYFFGETPADRTYKLPPSITKAEVHYASAGQPTKIDLEKVEGPSFVGMKSTTSIPNDASLASKVTYGIYHGTRLDYYTQHFGGELPSKRGGPAPHQLDLHAQLVDTDSGVDVFVIWQGQPLANAEVRLFCEDGHEEGNAKTDDNGKVSFNDKQVEAGLNGIVVGHTAEGESGKVGDQPYQSVSHYLTATFVDPEESRKSTTESKVSVDAKAYPHIPTMVTSFGAAIADDALYIYGGHTGRAHEYYAEAQARTLWRLDLQHPKAWESLGDGPRLQGLAMVAHDDKLYRIGGFTAKNKDGEEKDLWSQAGVASYDPETNEWQDLPPMPEPRSSFDAAVLGDQIYVVGGWAMRGDGDSEWLSTAYMLDLADPNPSWKALPEPPFQRRALSLAAYDGKIYAIGGMQKAGGPTTRVDVFDTKSQAWSQAPSLNGAEMDGFGSSSFAVGGQLYVTTYSGLLQRLTADGKSWETVQELERDRFFHRLLPLSENQLLAIGGASMSSGKFEELDVISVR